MAKQNVCKCFEPPRENAVNRVIYGVLPSTDAQVSAAYSESCSWGTSPAFQQERDVNRIPAFPWSPTHQAETLELGSIA